MLAGDVMQAAYASLYPAKLIALGRCLANGLTDEAQLDVEGVIARAIATIEEPHISVLATVERLTRGMAMGGDPPSKGHLSRELPRLAVAIDALTAVLTREGMVAAAATGRLGPLGGQLLPERFVLTDFGRLLLQRVRDADRNQKSTDS
jgi:hypothetical protein